MQEIVISGRRKINTGKYESKDLMASAKQTLLDGQDIEQAMQELNKKINAFLDKEEKTIREKIEKEAKQWVK